MKTSLQLDTKREKKKLFILFMMTIPFLILAVLLQIEMIMGILPGIITLIIMLKKEGQTTMDIHRAALQGLAKNKEVLLLLFFLAILLPSLEMGGGIRAITNIGIKLIHPDFLLVSIFLITSCVSFLLGSTIGSLSIIGIPFMSIALQHDVPAGWVAGALVSGAFVGDRSSPVSASFQMVISVLGIKPKIHFVHLLPTTFASMFISIILLGMTDVFFLRNISNKMVTIEVESITMEGVLALCPLIILFLCILLRKGLKKSFIISFLLSCMINFTIYDVSFEDFLKHLWSGGEEVGGIQDLSFFLIFIMITSIYTQLLEEFQWLNPLYIFMNYSGEDLWKESIRALSYGVLISCISPNQAFPILIMGKLLKQNWLKSFGSNELGRIMSDSIVLFAGLVPWSLLAIVSAAILNVPVVHYAPYSVFLWITPIVTIFYSKLKNRSTMSLCK